MTPEQFAYWLQGFIELTQGKAPTAAQWKSIKEHIAEVFKKVTPPVGTSTKADLPPRLKIDEKEFEKLMRELQGPSRVDLYCSYYPGRIC